MDLSLLLLTIISRLDGERSIYAGLHLLRGKRSGQTLQDVEYYSLRDFFCLLPKLQIELFDEAVEQLKEAQYISINEDSVVFLTKKGKEVIYTLPKFRFNGWDYRGREHVFFSRLSLIVQTLSYFRVGEKSFMPMQNDYNVQLFVKELLLKQGNLDRTFSNQLFEELRHSIEHSKMSDIQKTIFVHRLGGYNNTGWTWKQLSDEMNITPFSLSLNFIECLHMLLHTINQSSRYQLLSKVITNIKVSTYLTESTVKTKELFERGMSMQEISQIRNLKMSTVEDHFVEISINDTAFPIREFVSSTDIDAVVAKTTELGTKRLRVLKDEFPSLTYFQLRLILGGQSKGGGEVDIKSILLNKFGFEQFRAGQEDVIRDVISNRDTIAILPTGSGKSLCYQLPAYKKNGTVLIVSPLVALMEDQVAIMKKNGEKRVVALNSFLRFADRQRIMNQLELYKFIFVSPEMLMQNNVAEQFNKMEIAFIVVDEAHCISQWGFDFRPDYLRIGEFLKQLDRPNILALTATADTKVLQDIVHYLCLERPAVHKHSLDRKNISYSIKQMNSEQEKTAWTLERAKNTKAPGIIYVASRKRADELAFYLKEHNISIASYHAGMEQEDRAFIQEQFITGEIEWICATTAFGMGIHKNDIRQVIHENMPSTIAGYMQEVGRAGRDGNLSAATLLFTVDDIRKTRFIVQNDLPKKIEVHQYYDMLKKGSSKSEATQFAGISETTTRIIDYYLERMSIDSAIQKIKEQSTEKENQLQNVLHIINGENCIRKSLLEFYGETLTAHPTSCCSVCGMGEDDWLFEKKRSNSTRTIVNWEDRLARLLKS